MRVGCAWLGECLQLSHCLSRVRGTKNLRPYDQNVGPTPYQIGNVLKTNAAIDLYFSGKSLMLNHLSQALHLSTV